MMRSKQAIATEGGLKCVKIYHQPLGNLIHKDGAERFVQRPAFWNVCMKGHKRMRQGMAFQQPGVRAATYCCTGHEVHGTHCLQTCGPR
jgi:hypothetical protein